MNLKKEKQLPVVVQTSTSHSHVVQQTSGCYNQQTTEYPSWYDDLLGAARHIAHSSGERAAVPSPGLLFCKLSSSQFQLQKQPLNYKKQPLNSSQPQVYYTKLLRAL